MTQHFPSSVLNSRISAVADPFGALPRLADFGRIGCASRISACVVRGVLRSADAAITVVTSLVIAKLYVTDVAVLLSPHYLATAAFAGLAMLAVLELLGVYRPQTYDSVFVQVPRIVLGASIAFGLVLAAAFFLKSGGQISRAWLAMWFSSTVALICVLRLILAGLAARWAREGRLNRRAVIYGGDEVTRELIKELEADPSGDIRICGIFDEREDERCPSAVGGYPRLGTLEDLIKFSRRTRVDLVIVSLPIAAEERLADVARRLSVLPVDIKLPARAVKVRFRPQAYSRVGSVAMIDLFDKPITDWGTVAKWVFDKAVATLALVILAPLMLTIAMAIKLDSPGPVLFRQKRYGFNNKLIEVFKFRSMYADLCDTAAAKLVTRSDPRVTRVGRFIRKTSLDELPQLFNVVLGNLSLVGPRPHAVQAKAADKLYDEVVEGYFARHKVKPGITGWAQINGWRGETDTKEKIQKRVEHDLYYIENWSLFFDAYILARTPLALLASENAY